MLINEGDEKDTHNVQISVDMMKHNESIMRGSMTYHPSKKRLVGWREQMFSQNRMPTPGFGKFPWRHHPTNSRPSLLTLADIAFHACHLG